MGKVSPLSPGAVGKSSSDCVCLITLWVGLSPPHFPSGGCLSLGHGHRGRVPGAKAGEPHHSGLGPPAPHRLRIVMPFSHPHPSPYPARPPWGLHPQGLRMTSVIPVIPCGGPRGEGLLPQWAALRWGPPSPQLLRPGSPPTGSGMNLWTLNAPLPRWRMEQSTSWRPSTPCRSTRGWLTSRAA